MSLPESLNNGAAHLLMGTAMIAAACVLAIKRVITGGEALGVIGAAGGFSLGGSVGSASVTTAVGAIPAVSNSTGTSTVTITPSVSKVPAPVHDPAADTVTIVPTPAS